MSWDKSRAQARIGQLIQSVPPTDISVENFSDQYFPRRQVERQVVKSKGEAFGPPILKLPYRKAILVDGVHVYANLVSFDDFLVENDAETESSHRRALQFLHLHYAACDALVREFDIQRVDYHGSRLHAVIVTPTGHENAGRRAVRAVAFAEALNRLIQDVSQQIGSGEFGSSLRIGIDSGPSVAINSGRGLESEPLFLGNPANYAAKLADGDRPGIYLSDRIRSELGESPVGGLKYERRSALGAANLDELYLQADVGDELLRASTALSGDTGFFEIMRSPASVRFHYHQPPLRSLKFRELMPSRSVRMPLVSVFADLDGFTQYVTDSIASGDIAEMVARIHVMRGELTHVLRDDFDSKKVRFIGDCLHGVLAVGSAVNVNATESIEKAAHCVAALRSSFELCDKIIGQSALGLGVGFEYGEMPVTRIGNRGDLSIRCATGRAVSAAEDEQRRCAGTETAIGLKAYENGSVRLKAMFGSERKISNLLYEDLRGFLGGGVEAPVVITTPQRSEPSLRAHSRH